MHIEGGNPRGTAGHSVQIPPSDPRIANQLELVLRSQSFRASKRLTRFLSYIVDLATTGHGEEIKETSIALAVYDRPADYDPKIDPVVRNEARRLRNKLEAYYAGEGRLDQIKIVIPKGAYVPSFESLAQPAIPDASGESEEALDDVHPLSEVNKAGRLRRITLPSLAVLVLIGIALVVSLAFEWRHYRTTDADFNTLHIMNLTSVPGLTFEPAVSPDGRSVAFVLQKDSLHYVIEVSQPGGTPLRVTPDDENSLSPSWSPDGKSLAFLRSSSTGAELIVERFPGGSEKIVAKLHSSGPWVSDSFGHVNLIGPVWSRDGSELIASDDSGPHGGQALFAFSLNGGRSRKLTKPDAGERDTQPSVSNDGNWIAFTRFLTIDSADIYLLSISDLKTRQVTHDGADIQGAAWLSDDRRLVISSNRSGAYNLWLLSLDGSFVSPIATRAEAAIQPAASRDGHFISYVDAKPNSDLVVKPLSANQKPKLLFPTSNSSDNSARYSPDGRYVAFVSNRSGAWEIWRCNSDGRDLVQLTQFRSGLVGSPRWSPNSATIAFDARPHAHSVVYIVSSDGSGLHSIRDNKFEEKHPAWAVDGNALYLVSNQSGRPQIIRSNLLGTRESVVMDDDITDLQSSSDGRWLYYTRAFDGGHSLWRSKMDGTAATAITSLGLVNLNRLWEIAPGGVFYIDSNADQAKVLRFDEASLKTSVAVVLDRDCMNGYPNLEYSPTRNTFLYSSLETSLTRLRIAYVQVGRNWADER